MVYSKVYIVFSYDNPSLRLPYETVSFSYETIRLSYETISFPSRGYEPPKGLGRGGAHDALFG